MISYDKLVSLSAMATAVVAVIIGVVELQTTREYQRLSVEPYIEIAYTNRTSYEQLLTNSGLGPARIISVDVRIEEKPISNWKEAIIALSGSDDSKHSYAGLWKGRQIKAGEEIVLLHILDKDTAKSFNKNIDKLKISICYCSIYSECWIRKIGKPSEQIDNCPVDWKGSFPFKRKQNA